MKTLSSKTVAETLMNKDYPKEIEDNLFLKIIFRREYTLKGQVDPLIAVHVEPEGKRSRKNLSENGCDCRTGNAHLRERADSEDQKRVKNNVEDCTGRLRNHCKRSISGTCQHLFKIGTEESSGRNDPDDGEIRCAVFNDFADVSLECIEPVRESEAEYRKYNDVA